MHLRCCSRCRGSERGWGNARLYCACVRYSMVVLIDRHGWLALLSKGELLLQQSYSS